VRAVIDNNVLVSGLLWGDKPGRVLAAVAEGHVHIFLSEELLAELREVLLKRLGLS
jgi:putative PIN family toxin of toxin-antitoxin system